MLRRFAFLLVVVVFALSSLPHTLGKTNPPANPTALDPVTLATATSAILNAALPAVPKLIEKLGGIGGMTSKNKVKDVLTEQRATSLKQVQASAADIQKVAEEVEIVRQFVTPAVTANENIATMLAIIPDNSANMNDPLWARLKEEWEVAQPSLEQVKGINITAIINNVSEIELVNRLRTIQNIQSNDKIRITNIINSKDVNRINELKTRLTGIQTIVRETALVGDTELRRMKLGIDAMVAAMKTIATETPANADE